MEIPRAPQVAISVRGASRLPTPPSPPDTGVPARNLRPLTANQQTFDGTASRDATTQQSRGKDPRVVHDDQIAWLEEVRERRDSGVLDVSALPIEVEKAGRRSVRRRLLRDQLRRQIEIELSDVHTVKLIPNPESQIPNP